MLQEDSNGEASFEIIDNKNVTDQSASVGNINQSGNVLSNVPPPKALPSFIPMSVPISRTSVTNKIQFPVDSKETISTQIQYNQPILSNDSENAPNNIFYPTEFSAAIPPNKGIQHGIESKSSRHSSVSSDSITDTNSPTKKNEHGSIFGWVKDAVSSGGILQKVAEKAKSSVDSMITTLDPQMREYIYSGGDLDILVASIEEEDVSAIREAFQSVFGKATVEGISVKVTNVAIQPVGFQSGLKAAEEKIEAVFKNPKVQPVPVVAIESFLVKIEDNKWYELSVVLLKDPVRQLCLHTYTQMTPIPPEIVTLAEEETSKDYSLRETGLSVTVGSFMAENLGVIQRHWHHTLTGVYKREIILMAAKAVANLYRNCTQV